METALVMDLMRVLFLAALGLFACYLLRLPSLVGLLLTGIICGPGGVGLVHEAQMVESLAEIGIVLLLFTIGLEFSINQFIRMRRAILLGGGVQVVGTIVLAAAAAMAFGMPPNRAVFLGFMVSITSTAILLKVFQERAEVETPHGQIAIAVSIFQDLAVLVMVLLTPLLKGGGEVHLGRDLGLIGVKIIGLVIFVVIAGRMIMPQLLFQIVKTRSRELFMMTIVLLCMVIPWLSSQLGFSVALGAFIAGVIISETDYAHQAMAGLMPMRDVFAGLFFVSIGMLLEPGGLAANAGWILLAATALILLKAIVATFAALLLQYPLRTCLMVGVALAQVGEFSFLLAASGQEYGLVSPRMFQLSIGVAVVTMAASPFLIALTPRLACILEGIPLLARLRRGGTGVDAGETAVMRNHVILIGFGVTGRHLGGVLRGVGIPYVIIEMNAETVRREKHKGEEIHFGDATQDAVLERAGAESAHTLVITLPDPAETRRITSIARSYYPQLGIVARTRFASEVAPLRAMGATGVVADEYEAALELIAGVLRRHQIARTRIDHFVEKVRADGYQILREPSDQPLSLDDLRGSASEAELRVVRVPEHASLVGRSLGDLDLRRRCGLTLLTIRRQEGVTPNPGATETILGGDEVVLFGSEDAFRQFEDLMQSPA